MNPSPDNSSTLVLFARQPAAGRGKQRIVNELGESFTAPLRQLLFEVALGDLKQWAGSKALVLDGSCDNPDHDIQVIEQRQGNMGERINVADQELRADSANRKLIYIGSDAPETGTPEYEEASSALDNTDVVLIPAADGGVTLMSARIAWPELYALPWGTSRLCGALQQACENSGMSVQLLEPSNDVDTTADLLRLRSTLKKHSDAARCQLQQFLNEKLGQLGVVIPVKNDPDALREILSSEELQNVDNVVVVETHHNQNTAMYCARVNAEYINGGDNRGAQMNAGAQHLISNRHSTTLWFLHADAGLRPGSAIAIHKHRLNNSGGWFRFRFDGERNAGKYILEKAIKLRSDLFTPYGDQGIFVSAEAFADAGGFEPVPLFEEVKLIRYLRRHARISPLDLDIGVSERRWQRDGWVKRTLHNRWLALLHLCGVSAEKLDKMYRKA